MAGMKPKPMMKSKPKVNAKALTATRKSDKAANPKSPRNLRDIKITKERLAYEKGFNDAMKKKNSGKVLGGGTY